MSAFFRKQKKLGLALGSGNARGFAHIGVLKILDAYNIKVDVIAGTSMGSIIGGLYAAGLDPLEMEVFINDIDWLLLAKLFFPSLPRGGLIDGKVLEDIITKLAGNRMIEDLDIKFAASACDLSTSEEYIFTDGCLSTALRASSSIPMIFSPKVIDGKILADGGIINPVPVDICKKLGADYVIAVDVSSGIPPIASRKEDKLHEQAEKSRLASTKWLDDLLEKSKVMETEWVQLLFDNIKGRMQSPIGMAEAISRSLAIMEQEIIKVNMRINKPNLLITPDLQRFNFMDYFSGLDIVKAGEEAMQPYLKVLKKLSTKFPLN